MTQQSGKAMEHPLTNEELRLIGDASGHLFDRCDEAGGTPEYRQMADEHDAVMRLRRLYDQQQATISRQSALLAQMAAALDASREELRLIRMKDCDRVYNPLLGIQIDAALTAYRTLSPDPQWQRVPEGYEVEDK
jgi:hypothetical protein